MLLSILALTEYDPTIWSDATFPDEVSRTDLIEKICVDCAELELLYSDPAMMRLMIKNWCRTESHIWEKLADTLDLDYNPIYNLDVTYEETRTPNLTRKRTPQLSEYATKSNNATRTPNITEARTPNLTETRTPNLTETRTPNTTVTETPTDTTTNEVAGYNASTFENASRVTRGGTVTTAETGTETNATTGTETNATTGTDTTQTTGTESTRQSETETRTHSGTETETETGNEVTNVRRFGNQGVTMTQDMIEKERQVVQFTLYEYITKSFKNRFCLLVY